MRARYLVHTLPLAVSALAVGLAACEGCRSTALPAASTAPLAPAPDPGVPTVRLYFVTDLAGALEPCGCTKDQLGGLDHFGAWVSQSRGHAPAALVTASGPLFFQDEKLDPERSEQDRIKATAIAHVLRGLDFAAFAPAVNDWAAGSEGLARLASEAGAAAIVGLDRPPSFATAIVRDVGGVKIGLVGYGQTEGTAGSRTVEEVVARGAEDAKRQGANVLVALAAVGRGEAKRIADAVPELTAVLVGSPRASGDANTTAPQGEMVGDVVIVQGANHLQSVAVLDLYVREPTAPGRLLKFADATGMDLSEKREDLARRIDELHIKISAWERERAVNQADVRARRQDLARLEAERDTLDQKAPPARGSFFRYFVKEIREALGKEPTVEAAMLAYYKAANEHNHAALADRMPRPVTSGEAKYVGVAVCSTCHPGPRQVYDGTAHAHAYATLSSQFKEYNLECVSCHVTGYEKPGGSTVTHVDRLENVQCEVCHGPGSKHAVDPTDRTRIVARPDASACLTCHHPPHVERFDAVAKMSEILGPGHGMATK